MKTNEQITAEIEKSEKEIVELENSLKSNPEKTPDFYSDSRNLISFLRHKIAVLQWVLV